MTTVYHYLFVPLTISLAAITAGLETAWVRTEKEKYFHATKFWGKLFLINIAMGVVTGLVQEFQFSMISTSSQLTRHPPPAPADQPAIATRQPSRRTRCPR